TKEFPWAPALRCCLRQSKPRRPTAEIVTEQKKKEGFRPPCEPEFGNAGAVAGSKPALPQRRLSLARRQVLERDAGCVSASTVMRATAPRQSVCRFNANPRPHAPAGCGGTPLAAVTASRRKAGAPVPIGDTRTPASSRDGTGEALHETRILGLGAGLLERPAQEPSGARPRRHRSGGNPPGARRYFHAGGRLRRRVALPPRRHPRLRALWPRDQRRVIYRPLGRRLPRPDRRADRGGHA